MYSEACNVELYDVTHPRPVPSLMSYVAGGILFLHDPCCIVLRGLLLPKLHTWVCQTPFWLTVIWGE